MSTQSDPDNSGPISLDPVIHPLDRLKICVALQSAGAVEGDGPAREMKLSVLRDLVGCDEDVLSAHLSTLQVQRYVSQGREYRSPRCPGSVWVSLTARGAESLASHVQALEAVAALVED
ncbi:hypothetical protein COCCU_10855 [Corynebacterium occultum]|uniref:Winged helix DNA-binding domain-containing protein n=1 Tax=Corynebacterium occultum TaxID=2675219 RepID=A0A6B8WP01_9CORY|nr:MarR family transcriptional regulator [Corynebacterium occultum]QGU08088.1 hypothetical protein COCCU_10855 [Corynebacterium occultum]